MRTLLIFSLSLIIFIVPIVSMAAEPIVPCDGAIGEVCEACHVVQLGQRILTWFISVMAAVIALVFVIGGLKMVMAGGNEGEITKARSMMTNAIIGFIILLASWLIIDTVMKTFVRGVNTEDTADDFLLGPWNEISCVDQPELIERATTEATVDGGIPSNIPPDYTVKRTNLDSVSLETFWGTSELSELDSGNHHYCSTNRSGISIPIKVPQLSQNYGLRIISVSSTWNVPEIGTYQELSGSRDFGSQVIDSNGSTYGGGVTVILTPADSGRYIYFNQRPTGLSYSADQWCTQLQASFLPAV